MMGKRETSTDFNSLQTFSKKVDKIVHVDQLKVGRNPTVPIANGLRRRGR